VHVAYFEEQLKAPVISILPRIHRLSLSLSLSCQKKKKKKQIKHTAAVASI